MGKPPAAVIIARHGARLDAADKNWHLTSPAPYDPPLSYGGWVQARALGARIVSLLNSGEIISSKAPSTTAGAGSQPQKRKRRIIIHSSPYLRCLQTSIAISSGISQYSEPADDDPPHDQPHVGSTADSVQPDTNRSIPTPTYVEDHRSLLRVDAILGEWLCPDYFDEITPPPESARLIDAAKAELLRRAHGVLPQAAVKSRPSTGYFPGGWGSFSTPASPGSDEEGRLKVKSNTQSNRNRAGSYDTLDPANTPRAKGLLSKINTNLSSIAAGCYAPPTPGYAISPSDPIPAGYVAHARDACVKIDYQWDSMRKPQNWGDGGQLGEEWSSMHTRFRNGLANILEWYEEHDDPMGTNGHPCKDSHDNAQSNDLEDDTETILILVTHGAGCNALIGALTNEPALLDISTASLTMAVHKDNDEESSLTSDTTLTLPKHRRRTSSELSWAHEYSMRFVASTEHLRAGVNPSQVPSSLSSPTSLTSPSTQSQRHHRYASRGQSLSQGQFVIGSKQMSDSSSRPWKMSRPPTAPRGSSGLWSSVSGGSDAETDSSADDLVPNFGDSASVSSTRSVNGENKNPEIKQEDPSWSKTLPQRTLSQRGLWGSAPLNKDREAGVKRRWTVTERRL